MYSLHISCPYKWCFPVGPIMPSYAIPGWIKLSCEFRDHAFIRLFHEHALWHRVLRAAAPQLSLINTSTTIGAPNDAQDHCCEKGRIQHVQHENMFETIQLHAKSDPSHKLVNVGQIVKSIQLQLQYIQLEIPVIIGDKPTYPSMGHHFAHRHLMPSLSWTKTDGVRSSDKRARFHRLHVRVKMLPKWCTWCWKMLKIYEHVMIQTLCHHFCIIVWPVRFWAPSPLWHQCPSLHLPGACGWPSFSPPFRGQVREPSLFGHHHLILMVGFILNYIAFYLQIAVGFLAPVFVGQVTGHPTTYQSLGYLPPFSGLLPTPQIQGWKIG